MKGRKIQSKERYLLAFLIGTFLFLLIFEASYFISYFEFQRVSNLQEKLIYDIFESKLDYSLFSEEKCSNEKFDEISNALSFQGKIIDDLEKRLGKNQEDVLFRKKLYTLVELEHFEFVKQMNEDCKLGIQTILFFYSNENKDLGESERVGNLLRVVHNRADKLIIYSFDINLESKLMDKLKEYYGIEKSPSLIIDDTKLIGPRGIDDIESHLS